MNNCKYCKTEVVDGIKHEICLNQRLKELNKSDKNIPCMNTLRCGEFEEMNKDRNYLI